ncbi:MAG: VWA domain-containing protein, partial [Pseudomonadota bacterium]
MRPRQPTAHSAFTKHLHDFVATLRTAGIAAGSSSWLDAAAAAAAVGLSRRDDLKAALAATLVDRHEAMPLFEQAFAVYFGRPDLLRRMAADDLPQLLETARDEPPAAAARRLLEALSRPRRRERDDGDDEYRGLPGASVLEALIEKDFAQMTLDELAEAKRLLRAAVPVLPARPVRRVRRSRSGGAVDLAATLRSSVRHDGEAIALQRRRRRRRTVPLTLLIDVSGSMSAYSRALLHFAHCLTRRYPDVETFVFGTRLSHVTRELAGRDIDATLAALAGAVRDWDGGTRISAALAE